MRRPRAVAWLLFGSLLIIGCQESKQPPQQPSDQPSSGPADSPVADVNPIAQDTGPYDVYPLMSRTEVERHLGGPTRTESEGSVVKWFYDSRGMEVHMVGDVVMYVIQRSGQIAQDIAIGDDPAYVLGLATKVQTYSDGTRSASFERNGVLFTVFFENDVVAKVMLSDIPMP